MVENSDGEGGAIPGPPAGQTTFTQVNLPSLGLKGLWATLSNFSAAVILAGIAIWGILNLQDNLDILRADFKEDRKEDRVAAEEAHRRFLERDDRARETMAKQWDEIRELRKDLRGHQTAVESNQKAMLETQGQIKELIMEVKKIKTPSN